MSEPLPTKAAPATQSATNLERVLAQEQLGLLHPYFERDSMLYALAVGMGHDATDETELDFIYERRGRLRTVPTQALILARHDLIAQAGLHVEKILHGEVLLTLHRPLPASGQVRSDHRVIAAHDKGAAKGLLMETESRAFTQDGAALFDIWNLYFCRGDGGIGSSGGQQRTATVMPTRAPDLIRSFRTEPRQALIYRLTGDRNVIHADPKIARDLGFERPILHGSATLGIACREVLAGVLCYDSSRMRSIGARFTSIVYPGDTVDTHIWQDGDMVSFRCVVAQRKTTVLDHGQCRILLS